jgi:hypothetical protein
VISALTATRVIIALGIVNLTTGLLVFFSCRCLPGSWATKGLGLMKRGWYQKYYKVHCYIWWIFWGSVVTHAIFVMVYLGWPF